MDRQGILEQLANLEHPGREELQHDHAAEAIDYQPAQAIALGVDQAISISDSIETEPLAAQLDAACNPASEESGVNRFVRVHRQDAQRDARMAVVEAPPGPLAVTMLDI